MPKLICTAGPNLGDMWEMRHGTMSIGRQAGNDVVLHDKKVSRHHATIKSEGDNFLLEDLGSLNGTTVYEKRITRAVVVLETPIQFGNTTLLLTRKDLRDIAAQHVETVGVALFLKHKSKETVKSEIMEELAQVRGKGHEQKPGVFSKLFKAKEKLHRLPPKKSGLGGV
jgi:pSer/pThr/pTyr-binding forkhead associated (FHA) protein